MSSSNITSSPIKPKHSSTTSTTKVPIASKNTKLAGTHLADHAPDSTHDDLDTLDPVPEPPSNSPQADDNKLDVVSADAPESADDDLDIDLKRVGDIDPRADFSDSFKALIGPSCLSSTVLPAVDAEQTTNEAETFCTIDDAEKKVMNTEHLLRLIFLQADRGTLAAILRVCDYWFELAAPILWKDAPLCQLQDEYMDSNRLAVYAPKIREVNFGCSDLPWGVLSGVSHVIFAGLESVSLCPGHLHYADWNDITPFFQPSVKALTSWDNHNCDEAPARVSLDWSRLATIRCPLIKTLAVSHTNYLARSTLSKLIGKSRYLESVTLGCGIAIDTKLLLALVKRPYLKELVFDNVPEFDAAEFIASIIISGDCFPNLSHFSANISKTSLAFFLRIMPNLEKLDIKVIDDFNSHNPVTYRSAFEAISRMSKLSQLKVSIPSSDVVGGEDLIALGSKLGLLHLVSHVSTVDEA